MELTPELKIHSWLQEVNPKFRASDFDQAPDPFGQTLIDEYSRYAKESTAAKSHDVMQGLPGNLRPETFPDPFASALASGKTVTDDDRNLRTQILQSERQYNSFERRPRRKTRESRYDPWAGTQQKTSGSPNKRTEDRNLKRGKGKSRISDRFVAANVKSARLTVHPGSRLGIFKKGKASSPVHISKKAPYLNFIELDFLSKRERNDPINGQRQIGANEVLDGVTSKPRRIQHEPQPNFTRIPDRFSPLFAPSIIDENTVTPDKACKESESLKDVPEDCTSTASAQEKESDYRADRPAYDDQSAVSGTKPLSSEYVNLRSKLGCPKRLKSGASPATTANASTYYTLEDLKSLGNMIDHQRTKAFASFREQRGIAAEDSISYFEQDHIIRTGLSLVAPSDDVRQTLETRGELELGPSSEIFGSSNPESNGAGRSAVDLTKGLSDAAHCSRLFESTEAMGLPHLSSPLPWGPRGRSAHPNPDRWDKDESQLARLRPSNKPPDPFEDFGPFGSLGKNPDERFRYRRTVRTASGVLNPSTVLPFWYNDHRLALEPRKLQFWRANKLY